MLDTHPVSIQDFRIHWLDHLDDQTIDEVHRVVSAVVELGGAVGWLQPPARTVIGQWLSEWQSATITGRGGLALCRDIEGIQALGCWRASPAGAMAHVVELTKIMVHPDSRGRGLGRMVIDALIDTADSYGRSC